MYLRLWLLLVEIEVNHHSILDLLKLPNSSIMVSFLFCRILRILNMQQIGRNYYNPDYAFNIPQHKYIRTALELFTLPKGHTWFTFY